MNASRIRRIVVTGGPGSGKTTLVKRLEHRGHRVMHEVSRQITLEARENGIEQLFLTDPLEFSRILLERRLEQYHEAGRWEGQNVFFDRGLPDVTAYMDFKGQSYPEAFARTCSDHSYDRVFLLPPWEAIYEQDNERYESFTLAREIHGYLLNGYRKYGYRVEEVPIGPVDQRLDFLLDALEE